MSTIIDKVLKNGWSL